MISRGYEGTIRLHKERPTFKVCNEDCDWLCVVRQCYNSSENNISFSGSHISNIGWVPGLRTLVKYGIIERTHTTRGGKRVYYTMPDREGVDRALKELGY